MRRPSFGLRVSYKSRFMHSSNLDLLAVVQIERELGGGPEGILLPSGQIIWTMLQWGHDFSAMDRATIVAD